MYFVLLLTSLVLMSFENARSQETEVVGIANINVYEHSINSGKL